MWGMYSHFLDTLCIEQTHIILCTTPVWLYCVVQNCYFVCIHYSNKLYHISKHLNETRAVVCCFICTEYIASYQLATAGTSWLYFSVRFQLTWNATETTICNLAFRNSVSVGLLTIQLVLLYGGKIYVIGNYNYLANSPTVCT